MLEVRVEAGSGPRTARRWMAAARGAARPRVLVGAGVAVTCLAAIAIGLVSGDRTTAPVAQSRRAGAEGVAAAYGYPSSCLSVTIAADDPAYARADFDRARPCGRYGGDPTAIFRRIDGAWRPVLDAVTYSCPVPSLPPAVQVDLDVCGQTSALTGPDHRRPRGARV
ncbi:MAG: hypothetical protein ACLP01_30110 [Solirubrobacteraceae bacterium]